MPAPTLLGAGAVASNTSGDLAVDLSGVSYQADDIVVIATVGWVPNTTTGTNTQSLGSPWTKYSPNVTLNSPIDGEWAIWWARATSSTSLGSTVTITRPTSWDTGTDTCWAGQAFVFSGCAKTGNPFDALTASSLFSTANQNIPACTVSGNNRFVTSFMLSADNQSYGSPPSGWTLGTVDTTSTGTDAGFATFTIVTSSSTSAVASSVSAPAQGRYMFFVASFAPAPVTATASGSGTGDSSARTVFKSAATGSGVGTDAASWLRTKVANALGSGTASQTGYTYSVYDGPSRTYDELTRIYDGGNTVSATGAGSSTQAASGGIQYARTASSSGSSTESASGVVYVFWPRSASGSGSSTQSADGVHISPRTATGSGGATAGDTNTVLLTHVRTIVAVGTGSSYAYGSRSHIRTANGIGVGSVIIVQQATMFRSASSSAIGETDVALWVNAGKPLVGKVVMPLRWIDENPFYIRD